MTPVVRPARPGEGALVHALILELARYERLEDRVRARPGDVEAALFGPRPAAACDLVEVEGAVVGFALWFRSFSTFEGRAGLYLEDLYVRPQARGRGAGLALLRGLARRCRDEGLARLDWQVLDWNAPAIAFYDRLGAAPLDGWLPRRLEGEALRRLADDGPDAGEA